MDGDSKSTNEKDRSTQKGSFWSFSLGNLLQSARIRCFVCSCDEIDRILLGYRYPFLLHLSPIFWIILLVGPKGIREVIT